MSLRVKNLSKSKCFVLELLKQSTINNNSLHFLEN